VLGERLGDREDARTCPDGARPHREAPVEPLETYGRKGNISTRERGERSVDVRHDAESSADAAKVDDRGTDRK